MTTVIEFSGGRLIDLPDFYGDFPQDRFQLVAGFEDVEGVLRLEYVGRQSEFGEFMGFSAQWTGQIYPTAAQSELLESWHASSAVMLHVPGRFVSRIILKAHCSEPPGNFVCFDTPAVFAGRKKPNAAMDELPVRKLRELFSQC